jgi:hypothetical protein
LLIRSVTSWIPLLFAATWTNIEFIIQKSWVMYAFDQSEKTQFLFVPEL